MLKRTGIVRKRKNPFTKANRAARKRRQADTLSTKQQDEAARTAVMLRAGAYLLDGSERTWYGNCEKCGKEDFLQWCHIFTRGIHSIRRELDNAYAGCSSCHYKQHDARRDAEDGGGKQEEWRRWWREKIGETRYERIRKLAKGSS